MNNIQCKLVKKMIVKWQCPECFKHNNIEVPWLKRYRPNVLLDIGCLDCANYFDLDICELKEPST